MRSYLASVAGNAALCQRLGKELERGAFPHAYIVEGAAGCGKQTLAGEIALALACEHRTDPALPLPCRACPACRKILSGSSPDVIHIRRTEGKSTLGVEAVRALRKDVITVPNDLAFKIYIIHDAHTMTVQAQNALLLTLEEPPAFALFLLLAERADLLLETIRSRAPVLRLTPVSDAQIREFLLSDTREGATRRAAKALADSSPAELAALVRMANGCIGTALALLDPAARAPMMENRQTVTDLCGLLAKRTDAAGLLSALLSLGTRREEITERLTLLLGALRDLAVLFRCESAPLLFFTEREEACDLAERFTPHRLLSHVTAVDRALTSLAANANVRLVLVHLTNQLLAA